MRKTGMEREGGLTFEHYIEVEPAELANFRQAAQNYFEVPLRNKTIIPLITTKPDEEKEEYKSLHGENEIYSIDYNSQKQTVEITSGFPNAEKNPTKRA
jgi:hypothetical protein